MAGIKLLRNVILSQWTGLYKGPVKLIKWVKIAHSFLQSVSNQFHFIILSIPSAHKNYLNCLAVTISL